MSDDEKKHTDDIAAPQPTTVAPTEGCPLCRAWTSLMQSRHAAGLVGTGWDAMQAHACMVAGYIVGHRHGFDDGRDNLPEVEVCDEHTKHLVLAKKMNLIPERPYPGLIPEKDAWGAACSCGGRFVETRTPASTNGPWTCDKCGVVTQSIDGRPRASRGDHETD